MTLKEIEKVIDEADVVYVVTKSGFSYHMGLRENGEKNYHKLYLEDSIEGGFILFYYKRNEETGEMKLLAKVDHITKMVKKKIGDMSNGEIKQLEDRYCKGRTTCVGCPLSTGNTCLVWFNTWKKRVEDNKDKEFEIEVEDEKEN